MFTVKVERNINYELRNIHAVTVPFVRIEWFKKFPLYSIPVAGNSLWTELTHHSNKMTFSIILKEFLFEKRNEENEVSI
jgi:hypothetical protein